MRLCKFPLAPTSLLKKNEHLGIKKKDNNYSFVLNGITFKSRLNTKETKCRITLQHKITGETISFYDTEPITFIPDINKLVPKETGSNIGATSSELTREYGSAKAQKQLREKEKLQINKEALKTLKTAHREAMKDEKIEAAKGNKLDKTNMDCALDGSFSTATLSNMIDDQRIKLSNIAPKEVLEALEPEALTIISLTIAQMELLESDLKFQDSVLDILKKMPSIEMRPLKLCIMLEYMLRFQSLPVSKVRSKEPLAGCPGLVTKFLILNFTKEVFTDNGRSTIQINRDEKDKLFLMILALYGYLSNYKFPVNRLMVDIKGGKDRIKKLGSLINLKLVTIDKECMMTAARPYIIDDLS